MNVKFTVIIVAFVLLPIIVLSSLLFSGMEKNTVREKRNAMSYIMNKQQEEISMNVDSINMSMQFLLSDEELNTFLLEAKKGNNYTAEELRSLYKRDIAYLERMVNNNPALYQIRVYADSDDIQEMMPILYRRSRMDKLDWAEDEELSGWKFNYTDRIFDSFTLNQDKRIMSYVTPMTAFGYGRIAVLEVAMSMETMFPNLYDTDSMNWSCFIDEKGRMYFGDSEEGTVQKKQKLVSEMLENYALTDDELRIITYVQDGRRLIIGMKGIRELSGVLISVNDISGEIGGIARQRNYVIVLVILLTIILAFLINLVVKGVLHKFYEILTSIREVQKGDLDVVIPDCGTDEMGELGRQINDMLESIKQLTDDNLKHELLMKNTQIRALQNQINAHFIYNVLESIKMMAEIEERYAISDAVTALGKLLRYSMKWTSNLVTVREEIEYIRNYLALINLRFDYEIYLSLNIPEQIYQQEIPKMSLQPIVENAIYHGIEEMAEDTNIYIKGIAEDSDCIIEITDAGKGMTEEQVQELYRKISGEVEASGGSGNGIGLKNVQDRIKMTFGERYGIEIASKIGCYTKVMLRLPLQ